MNEETNETQTDEVSNPEETTKTYTEAEVTEMLQKEADRRVTQALAKQKAQYEKEKAEAEKLKDMDEQQRQSYELEQRIKSIEEKEKEFALKENRMEAANVMLKRGLPVELVDYVIADSAEAMLENINSFEKAFNDAVNNAVNKKVSTPPPGTGGKATGNSAISKEQFKNMTLAQQSELYRNDPELFKTLSGR